jgi:hypothetical protein
MPAVNWPVVPGRSYHIWRRSNLGSGSWTRITTQTIDAISGEDELQYIDLSASGDSNFYKVGWVD